MKPVKRAIKASVAWSKSAAIRLWHRPTLLVASVLVVVAGLFIWVWFEFKGFRAWTPNIVVGAITTAVTITVIDWAVRREARYRFQPEVDDVLRAIAQDFRIFLETIARWDYVRIAPERSPSAASDAGQFIDLWLAADAQNVRTRDRVALVVEIGRRLADRLEEIRRRDREAVPLELRRAIDRYESAVTFAANTLDASTPLGLMRESAQGLVSEAGDFYRAFVKEAGHQLEAPDSYRFLVEDYLNPHGASSSRKPERIGPPGNERSVGGFRGRERSWLSWTLVLDSITEEALHGVAGMTVDEIAETTNLSPPAVEAIVAELVQDGTLHELDDGKFSRRL